jgi:hypothetical protein
VTLRKNRHRKLTEAYAVSDHNAAHWYEVKYIPQGYRILSDQAGGNLRRGRSWSAGWYVVRICPCHFGLPVSKPLYSEKVANKTLQTIRGGQEPRGERDGG